MRTGNGFYIFRTTVSESEESFTQKGFTRYRKWEQRPNVNTFERFHFYWMNVSHSWGTVEYYDAPIWLDRTRNLVVVFVVNFVLVPEILNGISEKFHFDCRTMNLEKLLDIPQLLNVLNHHGEPFLKMYSGLDVYANGFVFVDPTVMSDEHRARLIDSLIGEGHV